MSYHPVQRVSQQSELLALKFPIPIPHSKVTGSLYPLSLYKLGNPRLVLGMEAKMNVIHRS